MTLPYHFSGHNKLLKYEYTKEYQEIFLPNPEVYSPISIFVKYPE